MLDAIDFSPRAADTRTRLTHPSLAAIQKHLILYFGATNPRGIKFGHATKGSLTYLTGG